jgi:hypothetical protein
MPRPTVANLERWNAAVARMPGSVKDAINKVLDTNAKEFADRLHNNVPKRTGDLETTIAITKPENKELARAVQVGDHKTPAAPIEFGHMDHGKHVPAHPFFFPLRRVMNKRLRGRMRRVIKKAVAELFANGAAAVPGSGGGDV